MYIRRRLIFEPRVDIIGEVEYYLDMEESQTGGLLLFLKSGNLKEITYKDRKEKLDILEAVQHVNEIEKCIEIIKKEKEHYEEIYGKFKNYGDFQTAKSYKNIIKSFKKYISELTKILLFIEEITK